MRTSEIVQSAAEYMQRVGKWDGDDDPQPMGDRACLVMALVHAAICDGLEEPRVLYEAFAPLTGDCLWQWSDAHSEDEVVAGMLAVAATLRAQEQTPVAELVAA